MFLPLLCARTHINTVTTTNTLVLGSGSLLTKVLTHKLLQIMQQLQTEQPHRRWIMILHGDRAEP